MGKILITCEKPDAAKNIANILDCNTKKEGYYESDDYVITWAYGHLIEWKKPEEINEEYKVWDLKYLPFNFNIDKDLKVSSDKRKQYSIMNKLINRSDIDYIVNAGDADREGLLIQEEIYKFAGNKKPIKVLWSQSLTEKEIIKCMNNLKERKDFENLLEAGKARSTIDYMMGYTYSRAIAKTIANNNYVSYGRCQTPLLNLLSIRENEITNFKVEDYYEIKAKFDKGYEGIYVDNEFKPIQFKDESEAKKVLNSISKNGIVAAIKEEKKSKSAPNLFSLPELQKVMGSKYKYTSDKTLEIAQSLYEKKLTSYPRTDTEYINEEVLQEIDERINSACKLLNINTKDLNKDNLKKVVKPNKVTGHHALLPTEIVASKEKLSSLSEEELKVYNEICKRFIAIMLPNYEYLSINVLTDLNGKSFISKGKKIIQDGYLKLYNKDPKLEEESSDEEQTLPDINKGDIVNASLSIDTKKTTPPPRYTTATIITLMEKYGIGRPATMAEIIHTNIKREFVELKKNKYFVTKKGMDYISIVPNELKDPNLTKNLEDKLNLIADGKYTYNKLITEEYEDEKKKIELLKELSKTSSMKNPYEANEYKCPLCGKMMISQKYSINCECGFKLNKEICSKKLSESNITDLLSKGKTSLIKGFKKKDGNQFDAKLEIDKDKKGVKFAYK